MDGLDRFGRFLNRRELTALARQLDEGEQVLAAVEAVLDKRGVLAATDRRLLFVRRSWLGARARSWRYARLDARSDREAARLELQTPQGPVAFTGIPKDQAREFQAAVARRPPAPGELVDFSLPPAEAARRKRLERLDRMLARGSLTRSEYERAKRSLDDETGVP